MKFVGQCDPEAVDITPGGDTGTPRIWLRLGRFRVSLSEAEAVAVAQQLVDAISQLRNQRPSTQKGTK